MTKKEKPNTASKKIKSSDKAEPYYRTIFEQSPDGIVITDTAGKIIEFNEAACRLLGYSREEFSKLSISDIDSDQTPEEIQENIKRILRDGRAEFEVRHTTKRGDIRNVRVIAQAMSLSGRTVLNSIWKDITDRRIAGEALRREMRFSEDIINSLPGVFYMFDSQGNFIRWNKKFEQVTGYTAEEMGGMHALDLFEGDEETLVADRMQQVFEKGKAEAEAYLVTKAGDRIPYYFTGLRTILSERAHIVGLGIDITERRRVEEELHDNYFTQAAINMILSESLQDITLEEILQKSLNMILSIPWIAFEAIGSISLVDDDARVLVMKAHYGLPEQLIELCAQIPFGRCICGRAALTQKIEFAGHVDERHETCYEGMPPHGHYAAPILFGGRTLGVLNIYLREGHIEKQKEKEFLGAVADTLAGIIVRKEAENELRESSRKISTLINNLPGVVYRCAGDPHWTMEYISEGISGMTGYPAEEFIGNRIRSFASIIEPGDQARISEDVRKALAQKKPYTLEYRISTASGGQKWVWERGSGVFVHDQLLALEGFLTDITERKMMEDRIECLAYFDALTGLPNRNLFIDRTSQGIARAEYSKRLVAVLDFDVDRFKFINDTYGLDTGDAVLREVARRLAASVREGDTAARIGGDGFGILLIDIAESEDVILVVEKVMKNVSQTIQVEGKEIVLTVSVGVSVYPNDGKDASTLMKNADLALLKAKQQGRKNYQFYTEELDVKASEFVLLEKNLFNAIKNEEFVLHYQPYWELTTKKIVGMEALIRWQSPELGLVSPGKFIPVLEDTRMIIEVGEWILRKAISQVKEWQNKGCPVVPVSVNLSLVQFRQKDLPQMIERAIRESGFYPSLLTLEMTESAFMQDIEFTYSVLERLKNIGVSISIDDFGTGYSSLAYLKRFPIDNLKIDMSFIREIAVDPDTASIVMAVIAMARTLNLKTIAEGIETEEQWKILRLLRCDFGQGYYVSKPVPPEEAEKLLV